jgi:hypothetical protein
LPQAAMGGATARGSMGYEAVAGAGGAGGVDSTGPFRPMRGEIQHSVTSVVFSHDGQVLISGGVK